jgi:heat-inducible transcriptional repressor
MADLEELGYITHMHTSAGRIPTDRGYRFYVDKLLNNAGLTPQEQSVINKEYLAKQLAFEEVMRKTSKVLSEFTHYAGIVSHPEIKRTCFKHIQFTLLNNKKVCLTLITDTGITKTAVVNFDFKIDQEKLNKIQDFMNTQLENVPLKQVKTKLHQMMIKERNSFFSVLKQAIELIDLSALIDGKMNFYLEGLSNVLSLPEFEDLKNVRSIMRFVDEQIPLAALMRTIMDEEDEKSRIKVFIGEENPYNYMNDCTIVLGTYEVDKRRIGGLGIIGPRRMDYGKAIATVQYVSDMLSEILNKFVI